jgi:hypothetical protein
MTTATPLIHTAEHCAGTCDAHRTTNLNVRSVPVSLARQIRADAASRGQTLSQWLAWSYNQTRKG